MPDLATRYHEAVERLDALITATPTPTNSTREAVRERARFRMNRLRALIDHLGSPARDIPKVHIGGTSGKGSTTTALAAILTAAGYRTGLHTSPYLQVPSEKLQWNDTLIEPERFIRLVDQLLGALDTFEDVHHITYGEAWVALVMLFLEDIEAEIGIIEVGAGGRFDLTNIIEPELSVITSVGIDHTNTLGNTIEEIAWHKAGIIKHGRTALSTVDDPVARTQIRAQAEEVGARLHELDMATAIEDIRMSGERTSWREAATGKEWTIGMAGRFQARNGQTAVAGARLLAEQGWGIDEDAIARGLLAARIPGRAETMPGEPRTMLDGAHNAQKVAALAADLPNLLPRPEGAQRIVVLGALEVKLVEETIESLLPHADLLITTSPQVFAKESRSADSLARAARDGGFGDRAIAVSDPLQALAHAQSIARPERGDTILVTGSLYLVGNIREVWFPSERVLLEHTSWPAKTNGSVTSGHVAAQTPV